MYKELDSLQNFQNVFYHGLLALPHGHHLLPSPRDVVPKMRRQRGGDQVQPPGLLAGLRI